MSLMGQSVTVSQLDGGEAGRLTTNADAAAFADVARLLQTNYLRNAGYDDSPREPVVLVLGAGASELTHFPRWDRLKKQVVEIGNRERGYVERVWAKLETQEVFPRRDDPQGELIKRNDIRIELLAGVACRSWKCEQEIRKLLYDHYGAGGQWQETGPPPLMVYELVAHLVKHGFIDHVITFNFDELLDVALANELGDGFCVRIFSGCECISARDQEKPLLIKVHGTVSSPESMRFTDKKTAELAPGMKEHLERVFGTDYSRRIHLLSLGYGWRDVSFYAWLRKHVQAGAVASLTLLRQDSRWPDLFEPESMSGQTILRTISTTDLARNGAGLSIENFVWSLTDHVVDRLKTGLYPVQPIARHLILGTLFKDSCMLEERVRAEVYLYIAKNKGFVHTASAPCSPRVEAYFKRLRSRGTTVTSANFLERLDLAECLARSPDPLGRGTYFTRLASLDALESGLASGILPESLQESSQSILIPRFCQDEERVKLESKLYRDFISMQIRQILESPDVEIASEPDFRTHWVFSGPKELNSYSRFGKHLSALLASDWTHLLAAVETKKFLDVNWLSEVLGKIGGRKLLLVVPSSKGLEAWHFKQQYFACDPSWEHHFKMMSIETPWWRHNRHFFLPLDLHDDGVCEFKGGIFFRRKCRANVVSVAHFDGANGRDCSKLLGDFCAYVDEAEMSAGTAQTLHMEFEALVPGVLRSEAMRQEGLEMVRKSLVCRCEKALDRLSSLQGRSAGASTVKVAARLSATASPSRVGASRPSW